MSQPNAQTRKRVKDTLADLQKAVASGDFEAAQDHAEIIFRTLANRGNYDMRETNQPEGRYNAFHGQANSGQPIAKQVQGIVDDLRPAKSADQAQAEYHQRLYGNKK